MLNAYSCFTLNEDEVFWKFSKYSSMETTCLQMGVEMYKILCHFPHLIIAALPGYLIYLLAFWDVILPSNKHLYGFFFKFLKTKLKLWWIVLLGFSIHFSVFFFHFCYSTLDLVSAFFFHFCWKDLIYCWSTILFIVVQIW